MPAKLPLIAAVTLLSLPAPGLAETWTIPGTVNAGGLNNTRFVSDVALTNPGALPASVTLSFLGPGGLPPRTINLPAGATTVYRNILDALWGAQGAGATQVSSATAILIRARTYNTAASGTYGVALPVFADDRILAAGKAADSLWISQSADGSAGYRTNVAVVFPDASGGAATVTIYDADGNEIASQDYSLDAAGFQQFGVGGFAGAVAVARARVEVTRGRAAGYSVVVDNVTGDSSLFTFEELPTGYQDVLVNGVARANGRNNTFFRTDGRFFNPTDEDAVVKASFHASGASNPAPVSGTFTVGAGRVLDVNDLLGTLLQLPVGSAGALRFETDAPVAILCRTSNVDPLGVKPGTFGAQQKPTSLLSFLMSADAGAVITGVRQNTAFRTNVGFAAGADGADYALTLKSAAGATVATAAGSLGVFGWTQPNVQDLFPNATIPDDASLLVKVTAGSVDVFDSSIDNTSGDPVVTPIMPLPVDIPSSAVIGPQGGSVRSADGRMTLKVPAGSFSAPVTVALTPEAVADADAFGSAYALTPSSLPLAKPALLVFRASGSAPALGLVSLSLAVRTAAGTFVAMGGRVDSAAGTLSVPISSTSPSVSAGEPAARVARDDGLAILVALRNAIVSPEFPTVLTDGQTALSLALHFPPSAGGRDVGFSAAQLSQFTVRWTRPPVGTLDSTTDKIVIYTAPHRIRRGYFGVFFEVTIRVSNPTVNLRFSLPASLLIVRRNWKIETEFAFHEPTCAGGRSWTLDWFWNEQGSFSIADADGNGTGKITKNSAATAQTRIPQWGSCPPFTAITGGAGIGGDVQFLFASFDFKIRDFSIIGTSRFNPGTAVLSHPLGPSSVSWPYTTLPFSLRARFFQESEWFDTFPPSAVTYRNRIISIDTP